MDIGKIIIEQINRDIKKVLKNIAKKTSDHLYDYVKKEWYEGHSVNPVMYVRTYEFLNSITVQEVKSTSRSFEIKVYFDTSKIHPYPAPEGSMLNQHMTSDGQDNIHGIRIGDLIVAWIENTGINNYKGIHMVQKTKEWLSKELDSLVISEFAKIGITAQVR